MTKDQKDKILTHNSNTVAQEVEKLMRIAVQGKVYKYPKLFGVILKGRLTLAREVLEVTKNKTFSGESNNKTYFLTCTFAEKRDYNKFEPVIIPDSEIIIPAQMRSSDNYHSVDVVLTARTIYNECFKVGQIISLATSAIIGGQVKKNLKHIADKHYPHEHRRRYERVWTDDNHYLLKRVA